MVWPRLRVILPGCELRNSVRQRGSALVLLPTMGTVGGDGVTLPAERANWADRPRTQRIRSADGAKGDGVSSKRVRHTCGTCGSKKHTHAGCNGYRLWAGAVG